MTVNLFQPLDWDTKMLGVHTAKLIPEQLSADDLHLALSQLKAEGIQLVFWCSAAIQSNYDNALAAGGILTDQKLTYLQSLDTIQHSTIPKEISFYPIAEPNDALLQLAFYICDESRFGHDPHLTKAQRYRLYGEWMRNSTLHHNAMNVMVITENQNIIAMVTLGEKNKRGDIGLIAVNEKSRGKGYGKLLTQAALTYFKQHGFNSSQVVTQQTNPGACKLYESCGYHLEKKEYFFHFWI